ncbi:MAG: cadherin repeat domain-containing protein [Pedosphaera sp.]|nr:cadherin repeat domain-containing protein [Pedosphaera sp.]
MGEGNGPGTNRFTIYLTDNGFPPLSATGHVTVIVREVNELPVVAGLGSRVVNEGDLLEIHVMATDTDRPAQTLSYSLKPPTPIGMTIDSSTGVLRWRLQRGRQVRRRELFYFTRN